MPGRSGSATMHSEGAPVVERRRGRPMDLPRIEGSRILVTGANGGLGVEFVDQALARGAERVYATTRGHRDWDDDRVVPIELDVDDPRAVERAAEVAHDVTI